jgi:CheY-like chemotaxis protein
MHCRLWGYNVFTADGGPSALDLYRTHRPGVLLLDIGVPRKDHETDVGISGGQAGELGWGSICAG